MITTLLTSFWRKASESVSLKVKKRKKTDNLKTDLHKDPIASVNAVLTTQRNFPLSLREWYKILSFSKNQFFIFSQYVPLDTTNAVITTSPMSFQRKVENFSLKKKIGKKNIYFKKMIGIRILLSQWMQSWPQRRSFPRSLREC